MAAEIEYGIEPKGSQSKTHAGEPCSALASIDAFLFIPVVDQSARLQTAFAVTGVSEEGKKSQGQKKRQRRDNKEHVFPPEALVVDVNTHLPGHL